MDLFCSFLFIIICISVVNAGKLVLSDKPVLPKEALGYCGKNFMLPVNASFARIYPELLSNNETSCWLDMGDFIKLATLSTVNTFSSRKMSPGYNFQEGVWHDLEDTSIERKVMCYVPPPPQ
jgi:hypothetical protein